MVIQWRSRVYTLYMKSPIECHGARFHGLMHVICVKLVERLLLYIVVFVFKIVCMLRVCLYLCSSFAFVNNSF